MYSWHGIFGDCCNSESIKLVNKDMRVGQCQTCKRIFTKS